MSNIERQKKTGAGNGCALYKKCGGCQLQNMTYDEQLSFKQAKVIKLLGRYCHIEEIIGMENPTHYRNKVQAAFGVTRGGKIISGVYQAASHRIVCVDKCKLEDRKADKIIVSIREMLPDFGIIPYNEDSGKGSLRHVLVKRSFSTGEIMVVLVTASPILKNKDRFIKELLTLHPEITTVVQNINPSNTSMVLGEKEKVLFGDGYITDILCGCKFRISARSFYQINPTQTEILYNTAIEYAGLTGKETVVDAYCGTGTIGIVASKKAGNVVGVELNRDAVRDAIVNAKINKAKNIYFHCADAGKFMVESAKAGEKADVVIMDPPRAGSDVNFLSSVVALSPKRIVYISCNPETQARDLAYLVKRGYKCRKIQPVDMFPHTGHVETVVLLSKGEVESKKVRVEFSLEDMDMSDFQDSATYTQIKDYVLKHSGLKVSNLYISQIKRKCGLEIGENYNLPKSEDSKQPQCPPEKEKAIREAFVYFGLV